MIYEFIILWREQNYKNWNNNEINTEKNIALLYSRKKFCFHFHPNTPNPLIIGNGFHFIIICLRCFLRGSCRFRGWSFALPLFFLIWPVIYRKTPIDEIVKKNMALITHLPGIPLVDQCNSRIQFPPVPQRHD